MQYKNLLNKRFDRLLVIELVGRNKYGRALWQCVCDCGNTTQKTTTDLLSRKYGKSCGCLTKELRKKQINPNIKPPGEAAKNKLMTAYRRSAEVRGKQFLLTKEQAVKLFESNCFYCGSEPSNLMSAKTYNGGYIYNGIDRIDSEKDYTVENSVSCCFLCNRMKSDMSQDVFLSHVHKISDWNKDVNV
jgi:hypothetical protein